MCYATPFLFRWGSLYFKDYWNLIDLVVVLEAWVSLLSADIGQLAFIRIVRLLRPLRAANHYPSIKLVVNAFLNSLRSVADIFLVLVSFLFIVGTLCSTLWMGTFNYRCQDNASGDWADTEELCYPGLSNTDDSVCRSFATFDDPYSCEEGLTCADFKVSPEEGSLNFDNVAYSMLTLFAACTLDGWSEALFDSQNVCAIPDFMLSPVVCSLCVLCA